ncbi:hypothetical protein HOE37_06175 [Candidatus Woesearchaeota archaeon]|jgi:hypothetical protein|nr:hypothetical protein [Candidatus Woesearchaeota archaeon]MBT4111417.1 hypothetical protein [Candidatus Woesearchaeota archaeon]MBT4336346.1 hypothetical protein [Candidatus Woesearchaeota archaeon]MBT4469999.1 hypothetical protein [Candidatus Woesearchaeota archaeon]MBT6744277.1 hypothetical protein [Candidatus Woesearchaeota archaeon]
MGDTAINDKVDEGLNYVIGDRMAHLIYMKEIAEGPPLREVFAGSEDPRGVRAYWLIRAMLQGCETADDFRAEGIPDPTGMPPNRFYRSDGSYTTSSIVEMFK